MARQATDVRSLRGAALESAKRRFQEIFPGRFADESYLAWERDYKWEAHLAWLRALGHLDWQRLHGRGQFDEIAARIGSFYAHSKLGLLAHYEWMALREALVQPSSARLVADGLHHLLHGPGDFGARIEEFSDALEEMPGQRMGLANWPVVTLFPFIANPDESLIIKPRLIKRAAERYGIDMRYHRRPNAATYAAVLSFARWLRQELGAWHPRDFIDIQGFLWVTTSEEYEDWPFE
jgi:hypothetical protein